MAYKKTSRENNDVFGTFLSNVSNDDTSMYSDSPKSTGAAQTASSQESSATSDSNSVALLLYLLEHGPQPAGPLLSGLSMGLEDFFIATRALRDQDCVVSTMQESGETFGLTERGTIEAERWKSTLSFMTGK